MKWIDRTRKVTFLDPRTIWTWKMSGAMEGHDPNAPKPEMVTPKLRKALTKQGYKILGTHSGVKLCRWTKAMLRGRGGCYKHAFYGIESHRCMETTPSLACANKCVFCWRHHTNPVGKEWKWEMNPAEDIVNDALGQHRKMINEMCGGSTSPRPSCKKAWIRDTARCRSSGNQ